MEKKVHQCRVDADLYGDQQAAFNAVNTRVRMVKCETDLVNGSAEREKNKINFRLNCKVIN